MLLGLLLCSIGMAAIANEAITLRWNELETGCEVAALDDDGFQQCLFRLEKWRTDYQVPKQQPPLTTADLDAVLAELPNKPEAGLSLWGQIWEWLKARFGDQPVQSPEWLRDWQLPQNFADWVLGLSVGACVLLALGIVGNELLQVYRSRAQTHTPGTAGWNPRSSAAAELPTLADIARYPSQEQPSLLLKIVLDRLQQGKLLLRRSGRTHQDLVQQAPSLGAMGESLTQIAQAAERTTYGDWQVTPADLEPLLDAGKRIVAQADAMASQPPADARA